MRKCCICGKEITQYHGNNPRPVKDKGECCNDCNSKYVVPARITEIINHLTSNPINTHYDY